MRRLRPLRHRVPRGRPRSRRRQGRAGEEGLLRRAGRLPARVPPGRHNLQGARAQGRDGPHDDLPRVQRVPLVRVPVADPAGPRPAEIRLLQGDHRHRRGLHRVHPRRLQAEDPGRQARRHRMPQARRALPLRQGAGDPLAEPDRPRRRGPHGGALLPRADQHRHSRRVPVREESEGHRDRRLPWRGDRAPRRPLTAIGNDQAAIARSPISRCQPGGPRSGPPGGSTCHRAPRRASRRCRTLCSRCWHPRRST